jgi:hypothetical protein
VRDDGGHPRRVQLDRAGTMAGRGAYLCRAQTRTGSVDDDCVALARRRAGIARALRCPLTIAVEIVESECP